MKKLRCGTSPWALCAALALCLTFTGCDKVVKLQAEATETRAKFDALNAESSSLEAQLNEARKALPPGPAPEDSARLLLSKASGEITILEANLKAASANLKETEAAVANLKKDLAPQQ